jgi:hypothetical protein
VPFYGAVTTGWPLQALETTGKCDSLRAHQEIVLEQRLMQTRPSTRLCAGTNKELKVQTFVLRAFGIGLVALVAAVAAVVVVLGAIVGISAKVNKLGSSMTDVRVAGCHLDLAWTLHSNCCRDFSARPGKCPRRRANILRSGRCRCIWLFDSPRGETDLGHTLKQRRV